MILVKNWNFPLCYALPIWGCCTNKNEFNSLESIHCRAARVICNPPRDMPSEDVSSEGENLTPAVPHNRAVNKGHRPRILPSFYRHNVNP